jgi:hypothetical protein
MIVTGLLLIAVGVAITMVTHEAAVRAGGGRYLVAFGPFVAGVIRVFRGLAELG